MRRLLVASGLLAALLIGDLAVADSLARPITKSTRLRVNGIGAIRIGMDLNVAHRATGTRFSNPSEDGLTNDPEECAYVAADGAPPHILFMTSHNRIVRIDVFDGSPIRTAEGIGIGSLESDIMKRYAGAKIRVAPSFYGGKDSGHDITVTIPGKGNRNLRYFFETDLKKVEHIRVGSVPYVEYVEGCV